jgi:hypothetical protein
VALPFILDYIFEISVHTCHGFNHSTWITSYKLSEILLFPFSREGNRFLEKTTYVGSHVSGILLLQSTLLLGNNRSQILFL